MPVRHADRARSIFINLLILLDCIEQEEEEEDNDRAGRGMNEKKKQSIWKIYQRDIKA